MTLHTYLTTQGIRTDDPYATFQELGIDLLDRVELALFIGDEADTEIPDEVYEGWQTLADVFETARVMGEVV